MSLEHIIIKLETISTVIKETAKLDDYTKAVELGHPNLKTNLADVEHYLEDTLIRLEELNNYLKTVPFGIEDLKSVREFNYLLTKSVPFPEDLYTKATELTKGIVTDFDEELEGDIW